ncbi:TPA: hypothetical protein ACH3X2_012529 [Trebouxia sp. C0005]
MPGEVAETACGEFSALDLIKSAVSQDQDVMSCLSKWGMSNSISLHMFSYRKCYHKLQAMEILGDMFSSPDVQQYMQAANIKREQPLTGRMSVSFEAVPASVTNMSLFDRLTDCGILRKDGAISKCMEDYIDGFQVSDKLRDMLLNTESDDAELYNSSERAELLFCIFEHLCLGGAMNQFEDSIDAYLRVAKLIYKDLVSVHRNAATNQVEVSSAVYRVTAVSPGQLFPHKGKNNFCYVSIDTHKRQCRMLYHAYSPFW